MRHLENRAAPPLAAKKDLFFVLASHSGSSDARLSAYWNAPSRNGILPPCRSSWPTSSNHDLGDGIYTAVGVVDRQSLYEMPGQHDGVQLLLEMQEKISWPRTAHSSFGRNSAHRSVAHVESSHLPRPRAKEQASITGPWCSYSSQGCTVIHSSCCACSIAALCRSFCIQTRDGFGRRNRRVRAWTALSLSRPSGFVSDTPTAAACSKFSLALQHTKF